MSRINRLPWGLQDILGSTSQGDNPSELMGEVRPGFDMFPLWMSERITYETQSRADINLRGQSLNFPVPSGELWIPIHMSASIFPNVVGQQVALSLQVINPENTVTTNLEWERNYIAVAAQDVLSVRFTWPQRIAYPPETDFQGVTGAIVTGVNLFLATSICYYKITV